MRKALMTTLPSSTYFPFKQLDENIMNEDDAVGAFFYNRVKNNEFAAGEDGEVGASHVIMLISASDVIVQTKPEPTKVS
jgi:hypothetical protein